jgi:hypothetical protein
MQYYVVGPDGNKYGPADVPTLKAWIAENRIGPDSMLEDFNTGQRMPASQVPGLIEGAAPTGTPMTGTMAPGTSASAPQGNMYAAGPSMGPGSYTGGGLTQGDDGKVFVILAWVFSSIGLVLCCAYISQFAAILGAIFAFVAASKGHPGAKAVKIYSIIVLVLSIISLMLIFSFRDQLMQWSKDQQAKAAAQQGR